MKLQVVSLDNKQVGDVELNDAIFGVPVRSDILFRAVNWQLAKRQRGTHKTKGISEISGTTKKPFNQKGTGRARAGSLRNAQRRGGATIFGPVVRSHAHDLTKKFRQLALRTALSAKAAEGKLIVLDAATAAAPKTKDMVVRLTAMDIKSALIIGGREIDNNFQLSARNIPLIDVLPEQGANVYDILRRDTLVLTRDAITALEERLA